MKTVSIRLSDSDCAALQEILRETGQTAQDFYETFTKAVIREGSIPDIRARSYMTVIDLLRNLTYIKNYKNSVI